MYTISNYNMRRIQEVIKDYISENKGSTNLKKFNKARRAQLLLQNLMKAKGTGHVKNQGDTNSD